MHKPKEQKSLSVLPGMSHDAFMKRVRAALGRGDRVNAGDAPVPPTVSVELVRTVPMTNTTALGDATTQVNHASPLSLFIKRASDVGMKVQVVTTGKLLRELMALVDSLQLKTVVIGVGSVPELLGLGDALRRKGVNVHNWRDDENLRPMFDVDAGITDVHAAIAESGTLVCSSDAGHSRGLSLVPPVHIAVVRNSDIMPDLMDYLNRLPCSENSTLPSSTVFITGPSKTADIEGVLVTGVHGPGKVHVLVVTDA